MMEVAFFLVADARRLVICCAFSKVAKRPSSVASVSSEAGAIVGSGDVPVEEVLNRTRNDNPRIFAPLR